MSGRMYIRHIARSAFAGQTGEYDKPTVTFGRRPENDIVLDGEYAGVVSGNHAEARLEGGRAVIVDLNSRNGVFVNGERISGSRAVTPTDRVRLGESGPEFCIEFNAVGPQPVASTVHHGAMPTAEMPSAVGRSAGVPGRPAAVPLASPNPPAPASIKLGASLPPPFALSPASPHPSTLPSLGPPPFGPCPVAPGSIGPPPVRPGSGGPPPWTAPPSQPRGIGPGSMGPKLAPKPGDAVPVPIVLGEAASSTTGPSVGGDFVAGIERLKEQRKVGPGALQGKQSIGMNTLIGVLEDTQKKERSKILAIAIPIVAILVLTLGWVWKGRSGTDWEGIIANTKESVYFVISEAQDPRSGQWSPAVGTAWFVNGDTLATNSHVAEVVKTALQAGRTAKIRSSGESNFDLQITQATTHPGYNDFQNGPPGVYFDVALLKVDRKDAERHRSKTRPLKIASREKLRSLRDGTEVIFVGYSSDGMAMSLSKPEPFSDRGTIRRQTDEQGNAADKPEFRTLLTYGLAIRGGASGSPVVDSAGEVVGFIAAVSIQGGIADSGTSYGPRADVLYELLNDETSSSDWKRLNEERLRRLRK